MIIKRSLTTLGLAWMTSLCAADTTQLAAPVGGGGGSVSAGNIEAQISVGDSIEGGFADASSIQDNGGYTGQLYDPVSLQVTASPTTVNEGSTRQLVATPLMDDDTTLELAASEVTWSVLSGPIGSFDSAGLATANAVYLDTPAIVQGTWLGIDSSLTLTVLNSDPDNFGSYAGDGIDDDWQVGFFGLDNPDAAPAIDADGDEQVNLFEFLAKVDPTDPASYFITCLERTSGQIDIVFSPVFGDRTYTVMVSDSLLTASFIPLSGGTTTTIGSERTVTDNAPITTRQFYRIIISKP